jgi:hypothetical protein
MEEGKRKMEETEEKNEKREKTILGFIFPFSFFHFPFSNQG